VIGMVLYEVLGTDVPTQAMNLAFSELKEVEAVKQVVGEPMSVFTGTKGRGRHGQASGKVTNKIFDREGTKVCQILFAVRGSKDEAEVKAQVVQSGGFMGFMSTMELEACFVNTRHGKIPVK
jgi:hypothetical protein